MNWSDLIGKTLMLEGFNEPFVLKQVIGIGGILFLVNDSDEPSYINTRRMNGFKVIEED